MHGRTVYAGVDIGSTTTKVALVDEGGALMGFAIVDTQFDRNASGEDALALALETSGIERGDIIRICATGYGRKVFKAADQDMPEIMCHGKGTVALMPQVRTIVDVGGQDSKVIRIDHNGLVSKFEMNDKCAAGTGRFFEVLSNRLLNVPMSELSSLSLKSTDPCPISSTCTVFAESEIVSYLSQGRDIADISMGLLNAIARRVYSMGAQTVGFEPLVVLSGGLGHSEAMRRALTEIIGSEVAVLETPQLPAALGAALYALESHMKEKEVQQ